MTSPANDAPTKWQKYVAEHPGHSQSYIARFRQMFAEGLDLHGEARFVDAMADRGSTILDAGCGPGRVGGQLHQLGHHVEGVDLDAELIAAAQEDYPDVMWRHHDLSAIHPGVFDKAPFDIAVCAGNVFPFAAPGSQTTILRCLRSVLTDTGRVVVGFGNDHDYTHAMFLRDVTDAGFSTPLTFSTWHLHSYSPDSDFLVAIATVAT